MSDGADCCHVGVFPSVSHVITVLGTRSRVVSAAGVEKARGTYAKLKRFASVPLFRDEAHIGVVSLLRLSVH